MENQSECFDFYFFYKIHLINIAFEVFLIDLKHL